MGNLRNPPLFLRPSVVRQLVSDVHALARGVGQVPFEPLRLSDACPLPAAKLKNEEVERFEPPAGAKIRSDQDGRRGDVALCQQTRSDRAEASPQPIESAATRPYHADRAGGAAQAPEGTSGGVDGGACIGPANACEQPGQSAPAGDAHAAGSGNLSEAQEPARQAPVRASPRAGRDVAAHGSRSGRSFPQEDRPDFAVIKGARRPKRARNAEIAAAYAAGESRQSIAARFNLSGDRVLAIAKAEGCTSRSTGSGKFRHDLDRAAVAAAYHSGLSARAVAERFGVSPSLVKTIVRESAAGPRPHGSRSPAFEGNAVRDRAIAEGFAAGRPVEELAEEFGLATYTVREIANRAGHKRRNGPKPSPAIAARNAAIAEALSAGQGVEAIIRRFGVGRATVYQVAGKAGIRRERPVRAAKPPKAPKPPKPPKPPKDPAQSPLALLRAKQAARTREIAEAYAAGDEVDTLVERFGISASAIYQAAKKHGVARGRGSAGARNGRLPGSGKHKPVVQTRLPIHPMPHVAHEPLPEPAATGPGFYSEAATKKRLQQAGRVRSSAEKAEAEALRIQRRADRAAAEDAAAEEFAAALARVRERRESGVEVIAPKPVKPLNEGQRIAAAFAAKAAKSKSVPAPKKPLEPAPSREECPRCGIPGWKGCDHWLPCEDRPVRVELTDDDGRKISQRHRTGGIQAVRL